MKAAHNLEKTAWFLKEKQPSPLKSLKKFKLIWTWASLVCCASYKPHRAGPELVPAEPCSHGQPLAASRRQRSPARGALPAPGEPVSRVLHAVNQSPLQSGQTYARKGFHCNPSQLNNHTTEHTLITDDHHLFFPKGMRVGSANHVFL